MNGYPNCRAHTGKTVHATVDRPGYVGNGGQVFTAAMALCGRQPGRRSLTHGYMRTNQPVNCPACLAKLAQQA